MKKFLFAGVLGLALTVSTAFAEHPAGWGIGIMARGNWNWGYGGLGGATLSLKIPKFPVYWGINLGISAHDLGLGLTGDFYLIDKRFAGEASGPSLGWYLGVGGFLGFNMNNYHKDYWYQDSAHWTSLSFGVRVPVGLSFQITAAPVTFEIFLALTPDLGVGFWFWDSQYDHYWRRQDRSHFGLVGGIGGEIGLRIWF